MKKFITAAALILSITSLETKAQSDFQIDLGADIVSSYVWRGVYQSGASIQPGLGFSYKGFSLGAWGSTTFSSSPGFKELDLSIGYQTGGFSIGVADYWWTGEQEPFYKHYLDSHFIEGTVGYHFGEQAPLWITWSTMFAGNGDKIDGDRKFSTFVEVGYDFSIGDFDLTASIGAAPWNSYAWLVPTGSKDGFQISSIAIEASRAIKFSSTYSARVFVKGIASPATDNAHLVVGVSF